MHQRILPILTVMVLLLVAAGAAVAQLPEHRQARGTLLSITDDEAVIRTLDGNEQLRVQITAGTTLPPRDLEQGDLVIIDYNLGPDPDQPVEARAIRMDERGSGLGSETEPVASDDMTESTRPSVDASATEQGLEETESAQAPTATSRSAQSSTQTEFESDRMENSDDQLPGTAGSLPMVALLGLVALGLGTVLRFLR